MSTSSTTVTSSSGFGRAFWERLWRSAGIQSVGLAAIAAAIYGYQPLIGAPPVGLFALDGGDRMPILVAALLSGLAVLNLMWFAAAIRATLEDLGQDGWGAAATAASAAVGVLFLLLIAVSAAPVNATTGNDTLASRLHDIAWAGFVVSSFPRAMLIMAGTFGFWRAGLISNALFTLGVAAVLLVLAGGAAWADGGFWAPDGDYSRLVSPAIGIVWVLVASRILLSRSPATRSGW